MAINKKTNVEKAITVANFTKYIKGKLMRIPNYSDLHAHLRSIFDNGTVGLRPMQRLA